MCKQCLWLMFIRRVLCARTSTTIWHSVASSFLYVFVCVRMYVLCSVHVFLDMCAPLCTFVCACGKELFCIWNADAVSFLLLRLHGILGIKWKSLCVHDRIEYILQIYINVIECGELRHIVSVLCESRFGYRFFEHVNRKQETHGRNFPCMYAFSVCMLLLVLCVNPRKR